MFGAPPAASAPPSEVPPAPTVTPDHSALAHAVRARLESATPVSIDLAPLMPAILEAVRTEVALVVDRRLAAGHAQRRPLSRRRPRSSEPSCAALEAQIEVLTASLRVFAHRLWCLERACFSID